MARPPNIKITSVDPSHVDDEDAVFIDLTTQPLPVGRRADPADYHRRAANSSRFAGAAENAPVAQDEGAHEPRFATQLVDDNARFAVPPRELNEETRVPDAAGSSAGSPATARSESNASNSMSWTTESSVFNAAASRSPTSLYSDSELTFSSPTASEASSLSSSLSSSPSSSLEGLPTTEAPARKSRGHEDASSVAQYARMVVGPVLRHQSLQSGTEKRRSLCAQDSLRELNVVDGLDYIFNPLFHRACATRLSPFPRSFLLDGRGSYRAAAVVTEASRADRQMCRSAGDQQLQKTKNAQFDEFVETFLGSARVEHRRSVSEPRILLHSSHREPSVYEKLLYNPRAYGLLSHASQHEFRKKTEDFEMAWTPIRPIAYDVQDHALGCTNLAKWPDSAFDGSLFAYKYGNQCCQCPYEQGVSFFIPPFYFQALTNRDDRSTMPPYHLLGRTVAGMLGLPASEPEVCITRGPRHMDYLHRFGDQDTATSRPTSDHVGAAGDLWNKETADVVAFQGDTERESYFRGRRVISLKKQHSMKGHKSGGEVDYQGLKIAKQVTAGTHPSLIGSLSLDHQYLRRVMPSVWIRSRSCCPKDIQHLDLIIFFGGKDMVALDWLPLINQWIQHQITQNQTAAGELKRNSGTLQTPQPSRRQAPEATADAGTPVIPRHLPAFDPALLQQRRRSSVRALQASRAVHGVTAHSSSPERKGDTTITSLQTQLLKLVTKEQPSKVESQSVQCRPFGLPSSCTMESVKLRTNCGFGLVEYPGYGSAGGLPSPSSCVDSGIEVIRHCIASTKPETVDLHVVGYSLGCAIASRVVALVAERLSGIYDTASEGAALTPEPLSKVTGLKTLVLVAPFTSTWDCVNTMLHVPKKLHDVSSFLLDSLPSRQCQYNNQETLGRLANTIRRAPERFPRFGLTILFGDNDPIIAKHMGGTLASHFRRSLGKGLLSEHRVAVRCIRVAGADHGTVLDPDRLIKVFTKYHSDIQLCTLERQDR